MNLSQWIHSYGCNYSPYSDNAWIFILRPDLSHGLHICISQLDMCTRVSHQQIIVWNRTCHCDAPPPHLHFVFLYILSHSWHCYLLNSQKPYTLRLLLTLLFLYHTCPVNSHIWFYFLDVSNQFTFLYPVVSTTVQALIISPDLYYFSSGLV